MMFVGGSMHGQSADGIASGDNYAHKSIIGRGEIHRRGFTPQHGEPVYYYASMVEYYRRVDLSPGSYFPAVHYVHASMTDQQARKEMKL